MEMERRDTQPRGERLEIDVLVQLLLDFDQQRNEALFFSFHGRFAAGGARSVRKGLSTVNWTLAPRLQPLSAATAWRKRARRDMYGAMIAFCHRWYFWYYGFPKPLAEEG
jgi:hypothetical protein